MNFSYILHVTETKQDKKGLYPVKVQLDCNGERLQITIPKTRAKPEHWCKDTQRLTADAPDAGVCNVWLDRIEKRYYALYELCDKDDNKKILTVKEVRAHLFMKESPKLDVFGMMNIFLEQQRCLMEAGELALSTYRLYAYRTKVWKAYFTHEQITDVQQVGDDIQLAFYQFARTFKSEKSKKVPQHNTVVSLLIGLRVFFEYCRERKWLKENPIKKTKYSNKRKEKIYLTEAELDALRALDLKEKGLTHARDLFLLVCNTGLSYSDLSQICPENIRSEEGREVLIIKRKKTKVEGVIPLFEEAREILGKHKHKKPKICYDLYSRSLKKLQKCAGISKKLTSHVARKTFGNMMLNKHLVPLEMVSKMMCHANIQTTAQYYTDIDIKTVCRHTAHIK